MHGKRGFVHGRRDGHCSGRYASYWNAVLLPPTNDVSDKVIFLCLSVILFTGGEYLGRYTPQQVHPLAGTPPGRYPPLTGTPWQVHLPGRYTPLAGTPPQAGTPPGGYTPPGRYTPSACWDMVNKRVVRILLECILVCFQF